MTEKTYRRQLTYSGDYYSGTPELWKSYWEAVENHDWDFVRHLETDDLADFYYDP